ncbi:uncharacterized protein LOC107270995 [Cephus cinctus]|uniref:Uncharacterized protein LOC107270995 n=1 Tax=Cephus cinctus TaxID=211228 RepID=A0AAJ7FPK5_CEPCN|nr:uncharacterized protein LOC107270995 [Cephus cinctus]
MFRVKFVVIFIALTVGIIAFPQQTSKSKRPTSIFKNKLFNLELPDNATTIRENIIDTFSCKDRIYGYYADIENECQIFHVCLPHGKSSTRWSFICPAETRFNQATFVCTLTENSIPCEQSEQYYTLNEEIGKIENKEHTNNTYVPEWETETNTTKPFIKIAQDSRRKKIQP